MSHHQPTLPQIPHVARGRARQFRQTGPPLGAGVRTFSRTIPCRSADSASRITGSSPARHYADLRVMPMWSRGPLQGKVSGWSGRHNLTRG
jgi:hypothetical protein